MNKKLLAMMSKRNELKAQASALLDAAHAADTEASVVIRGKAEPFEVTDPPFVESHVR